MCAILGFMCKVFLKKRQRFENVCKQLKKKTVITEDSLQSVLK